MSEPQAGFLLKHWQGEYPLGWSYWVNTLLVPFSIMALIAALLPWIGAHFSAQTSSAAVLLSTGLIVVIWLWSVVGSWRSARRHVARGGKPLWASLVRIMLSVSLIWTMNFAVSSRAIWDEHWEIASGQKLDVAAVVRVSGKTVWVNGVLGEGSEAALQKALNTAPGVTQVVLHSPGGWVRQGYLMAHVITQWHLDTYVDKECSSACTIAFLAGMHRLAAPGARIGFHSFSGVRSGHHAEFAYLEHKRSQLYADMARVVYRNAGVNDDFIAHVVATPSSQVWYPTHAELQVAGVLTETTTAWQNIGTRGALAQELRRAALFETMAAKYPQSFERMLDMSWANLQAGKSEAEVKAAGAIELRALVTQLMPIASDATLVEMAALLQAKAEAFGSRYAAACTALAFPASQPVQAPLPQTLVAREMAFITSLLRDNDERYRQSFSAQETQELVQELVKRLTPAQVRMLQYADMRAASPVSSCAAVVAYFRELNALPETARAKTLRALHTAGAAASSRPVEESS